MDSPGTHWRPVFNELGGLVGYLSTDLEGDRPAPDPDDHEEPPPRDPRRFQILAVHSRRGEAAPLVAGYVWRYIGDADHLLEMPPDRFRTLAEMHPGDLPEAAIPD